jgi:hypothetical protein
MIIWLVVTGTIGNFIIPTDYRNRFFRGVGLNSTTLTSSDEKYHGILPCHQSGGWSCHKKPHGPMAAGESPPFSTSTQLGHSLALDTETPPTHERVSVFGMCLCLYIYVYIYMYIYICIYIYIYIHAELYRYARVGVHIDSHVQLRACR